MNSYLANAMVAPTMLIATAGIMPIGMSGMTMMVDGMNGIRPMRIGPMMTGGVKITGKKNGKTMKTMMRLLVKLQLLQLRMMNKFEKLLLPKRLPNN